jgi:protein-tyrosine phosphatase
MIDFHSHILPGLDDGAADITEAAAMARILSDAGFSEVCCTPHRISGCYDADNESVGTKTEELRKSIDTLGIDVLLHPGSEYYLDEFFLEGLEGCVTFRETQFVLVEISNHMTVEFIREACYRIRCRGYIPVIAHPERCNLFDLPPSRTWFKVRGSWFNVFNQTPNLEHRTLNSLVEYLIEIGCRFQGNIGSFAGIYGESVRKRAVSNLREGLYSYLGSDAHSSRNLAEWLDKGLREIEQCVGSEGLQKLLNGLPVNEEHRLLRHTG